ncbi:MAG: maltose/maltodextrin ABC transporter substrate-binding protein MalE [Spartobacteria bacterium]|nr:maltose/maltodextrin ABC transporter substrate-binding protein MalE [Spartobacteria bacterium]
MRAVLMSVLVAGCVMMSVTGARAVEEGKLLVWINGDKAYTALQELGNKFEEETGIPVSVQHPVDLPSKFGPAAQAGKGPDIVIWAHDRLGGWAQSGLIQPLNITPDYKAKFHPKGWDAFTYNNKVWGYPITMEVVTLIYNRKLMASPPKDLQEVMKLGETYSAQNKYVMMWAYNTPFFTWPFLAGAGAYVYAKNPDGGYNTTDVGVNAGKAAEALNMIYDMIKENIMPQGVTYDVMTAKMSAGDCAMMVNGPWAWNDLKTAGIDFGIDIIPGYSGPAKPFVGILGAMVDAKTPNADLVELFMQDYVLTVDGLKALDADTFDGPPALVDAYNVMKSDPNVAASMANVELGVLMPNIPEMGVFWSSLESAIKTVTAGQVGAADALNSAAEIMKKENSK